MKKIIAFILLLAPIALKANNNGPTGDSDTTSSSSSLSDTAAGYSSEAGLAADDDGDDVADAIMGSVLSVDEIVQEYLQSQLIPRKQRGKIQVTLESLSVEQRQRFFAALQSKRWWGGKKDAQDKKMVAALLALVAEMKEQTEEMRGSGELQKAAYEQQVASAEFARYQWKMGFIGAIGTAVVTNAVQAVFNIMQANALAEQSDNTTAC